MLPYDEIYKNDKYCKLLAAHEKIREKAKQQAYWAMYILANYKDGLQFNKDLKEFKRWEKFSKRIDKEIENIRKNYEQPFWRK